MKSSPIPPTSHSFICPFNCLSTHRNIKDKLSVDLPSVPIHLKVTARGSSKSAQKGLQAWGAGPHREALSPRPLASVGAAQRRRSCRRARGRGCGIRALSKTPPRSSHAHTRVRCALSRRVNPSIGARDLEVEAAFVMVLWGYGVMRRGRKMLAGRVILVQVVFIGSLGMHTCNSLFNY